MDISKWALNNSNLINFFIAILVAGGIFAASEMSKLEDPEIKVKQAMVVTTYPGASAHQVELEVTDILEKRIRTMGNINNIESMSFNDLSIITVDLLSIVKDDDVEQHWDLLRRKVNDAINVLPEGARPPIVKDDFGNVYGMFYALTSEDFSHKELSDYAELIKREVNNIDGVERVELYGKRTECINISLNQERMSALGVKPIEVLSTIDGHNKTTYTGYFKGGDNRIRVSVSDKFKTVEQIGEMLIQGHDNDQLRLRDIAIIERDFEDPTRNELLYDNQSSIGILIAATSGTDILKVGNAVEDRINEIVNNQLPTGITCNKVFNQPDRVSDSLLTFIINLIESVIIVIVILMITMGFKSGMIIGISLVITVFGSFLFLQSADGTMQRVSLGAFILAMGMLVDNAIVIMDGILIDLKSGKKQEEALTAIGRQTAIPLLGATLIAIIAFLPIFLSPDTAGVYTRDLFIVLAVSLLLSWILALVHVPLMAKQFLRPKVTSDKVEYNGKIYSVLRKILNFGLNHRIGFIISMVVLLILSVVGYKYMRHGFFPDMQYDQLYMEYKLPEGTNITKVKNDLAEIENYLHTREEIVHITTSLGGTPGRYNLVRSIATPSLSYGEMIIDFTSPESLVENIDDIQNKLNELHPEAYIKLKRYNLMYKKFPIEAMFVGPDPAVLHELADSARRIMEQTEEVCLITTDWEPQTPMLNVEYDQATARSLGLSRNDVSISLLAATSGIPIGTFYEGIQRNNVYLKALDYNGNQIENLENTQVFSSLPNIKSILNEETMLKVKNGSLNKTDLINEVMTTTPLKQVCTSIDIKWEAPVVTRFNGQRSQKVQCSPAPGIETEKAWKILSEKIEKINLPDGYYLQWQGEKSASKQSMKYLFKNFPLAIILIIGILIMLFKDYRKPLIILCCLPMILIGVVAVMLITGKTFNFVAIVGTLGLIGMLIKNGIVLMDEIMLQLKSGIEPTKALIDSAQSRLRPVMMASLTTILGMIPLLPDAMFGSLAAAIMGGLLISTIITLIFIPILYALFFHIKQPKQ